MGIRELVLEQAKKEGLEKGKAEKSYRFVKNLITKMGLSDDKAADIAEVPVDFVKKVRIKLKSNTGK